MSYFKETKFDERMEFEIDFKGISVLLHDFVAILLDYFKHLDGTLDLSLGIWTH